MGFSRQEYWIALPFPSLGDLPDPGIKPNSPALAGGFFTAKPPGKPHCYNNLPQIYYLIFLEVGSLSASYGLKPRYLWSHVLSRGFRGECACMPSCFSHVQLFVTLCDPMDYSLPGSSFHGILQTRIPEWVAISFSRGSSWPRDHTHISYVSSVHGILQTRVLEGVARPSSRGPSQPRDWTHISYVSCTGKWVLYH